MRSCETDSIGHELNLRWVGVAVSNNIIRLGNVYQGSCWFFFSYQSRLAQLVHHLLVSLAMMDRHHQPPPPSPWKQSGRQVLNFWGRRLGQMFRREGQKLLPNALIQANKKSTSQCCNRIWNIRPLLLSFTRRSLLSFVISEPLFFRSRSVWWWWWWDVGPNRTRIIFKLQVHYLIGMGGRNGVTLNSKVGEEEKNQTVTLIPDSDNPRPIHRNGSATFSRSKLYWKKKRIFLCHKGWGMDGWMDVNAGTTEDLRPHQSHPHIDYYSRWVRVVSWE